MDKPSSSESSAAVDAARIANGHAFAKHRHEFGKNLSRDQFRAIIEETIARALAVKHLRNGRTAYWSETAFMIVIVSTKDVDAGTAFRPLSGREYFENLT